MQILFYLLRYMNDIAVNYQASAVKKTSYMHWLVLSGLLYTFFLHPSTSWLIYSLIR